MADKDPTKEVDYASMPDVNPATPSPADVSRELDYASMPDVNPGSPLIEGIQMQGIVQDPNIIAAAQGKINQENEVKLNSIKNIPGEQWQKNLTDSLQNALISPAREPANMDAPINIPPVAKSFGEFALGAVGVIDKGLADMFDKLDWVQTTTGDAITQVIYGKEDALKLKELRDKGILSPSMDISSIRPFKVAADALKWSASGTKEMPNTLAGNIVGGTAGVVPLIAATLILPEVKTGEILYNLGIKSVSKFGMVLGAEKAIEGAENAQTATQQITAPVIGALEGYVTGFAYDNLGAMAGKIGLNVGNKIFPVVKTGTQAINKALVTQGTSTMFNAIAFGGLGTAQELLETGKATSNVFLTNFGVGIGMSVPFMGKLFLAKGLNTFISTPTDVVNRVAKVDITPEQLHKAGIDFIDKIDNNTSIDKESDMAAAAININLAALKAFTDEVKSDPFQVIEMVKQSSFPGELKASIINKINEVVSSNNPLAEELKPLSDEIKSIDSKVSIIKDNQTLSSVEQELQINELNTRKKELSDNVAAIYGKKPILEITQEQVDKLNKARNEERDVFDAKIKETQDRLQLPVTPDIAISDVTEEVLAKIDNKEPVINEKLKEASNNLYDQYKRLNAMKQSDNRLYTTEQLNDMMDVLGEEITNLNNRINEQETTGEFQTEKIKLADQVEVSQITEIGKGENTPGNEQVKPKGAKEKVKEETKVAEVKPGDKISSEGKKGSIEKTQTGYAINESILDNSVRDSNPIVIDKLEDVQIAKDRINQLTSEAQAELDARNIAMESEDAYRVGAQTFKTKKQFIKGLASAVKGKAIDPMFVTEDIKFGSDVTNKEVMDIIDQNESKDGKLEPERILSASSDLMGIIDEVGPRANKRIDQVNDLITKQNAEKVNNEIISQEPGKQKGQVLKAGEEVKPKGVKEKVIDFGMQKLIDDNVNRAMVPAPREKKIEEQISDGIATAKELISNLPGVEEAIKNRDVESLKKEVIKLKERVRERGFSVTPGIMPNPHDRMQQMLTNLLLVANDGWVSKRLVKDGNGKYTGEIIDGENIEYYFDTLQNTLSQYISKSKQNAEEIGGAAKTQGEAAVKGEEVKSVLNQDKDLLGKPKAKQLMTLVPESDLKMQKGGTNVNQILAIQDALIDKPVKTSKGKYVKMNTFEKLVRQGKMTANDAKLVIESAGQKVPKNIEQLITKPNEIQQKQTKNEGESVFTIIKDSYKRNSKLLSGKIAHSAIVFSNSELVASLKGGYERIPTVYIRFGKALKDKSGNFIASKDYSKNKYEDGISVYQAFYDKKTNKYILLSGGDQYLSTQMEMGDREAYLVDGAAISTGADGENVLNSKTFKEISEIKLSNIVTEDVTDTSVDGKWVKDEPSWGDSDVISDADALSMAYLKAKKYGNNIELVNYIEENIPILKSKKNEIQQKQILEVKGEGQAKTQETGKPEEKVNQEIDPSSPNYSNMTEDGQGNYVFYHQGRGEYETIDPSKYGSNKANITSKEELAAMNRVGGMSMYNTNLQNTEGRTSGNTHEVKVLKGKVYDADLDPNDYSKEAKERFKNENPGKGFSDNDLFAYITKIAGENGYDMTVVKWGKGTRGQTVKALPVSDIQIMKMNMVEKDFKEQYVSNKDKTNNKSALTTGFFSDVVNGISEKFKPFKKWASLEKNFTSVQKGFKAVFDKFKGNFDEHIATSIPFFRETQIKVGAAITDILKKTGGLVYDIGGSEGGFVKAISELSKGKIKSINLDTNLDMQKIHESKRVKGSDFVREAFYQSFTEKDGTVHKKHIPVEKADVVHESMVFQFIDKDRAGFVSEVAKNYLKEDGVFLTEEKVLPGTKEEYDLNEAKKDEYKLKSYTQEQVDIKRKEILDGGEDVFEGMKANQTQEADLLKALQDNFKYVAQYWDSGNFKGYAASNNQNKLTTFLSKVDANNHEYSTRKNNELIKIKDGEIISDPPKSFKENLKQEKATNKISEGFKSLGAAVAGFSEKMTAEESAKMLNDVKKIAEGVYELGIIDLKDLTKKLKLATDQYIQDKEVAEKIKKFISENQEEIEALYLAKSKPRAFAEKIEADKGTSDEVKKGLSKDARNYIPIGNDYTVNEIQTIITEKGIPQSMLMTMDLDNNIPSRTRVALGLELIDRFNSVIKDKNSTEADIKKSISDSLSLGEFMTKYGTALGQGVQAFAIWARMHPKSLVDKITADIKKAGFKMTPEQQKELERLADMVDKAPEGFQKFNAMQDLLMFQARTIKIPFSDMVMSVWYANILSGYTTQLTNILANLNQTVGELVKSVVYNPKMGGKLLTGLFNGYGRGMLEAWAVLKDGYSPLKDAKFSFSKNSAEPSTLESYNGFKLLGRKWNPFAAHRYVQRAMVAADTFFFQGLKGMRAKELTNMLENGKYHMDSRAIDDYVSKKLFNHESELAKARVKAEKEGLVKGGLNYKRRIWEIMDQALPNELNNELNSFASRGTFNYSPEGRMGKLTDKISDLVNSLKIGKSAPLKFVVPFTTILSNVANNYLDWSPYGYVRAAKGRVGGNYDLEQGNKYAREYTKEERAKELISASAGTLGAMALMYLALTPMGDDDEPLIDITANGTGDFRTNYNLAEKGWQKYSVRIANHWYSYANTPLALPLTVMGNILDQHKYKGSTFDDKNFVKKTELILWNTTQYFTDLTFLRGMSEFLGAFSEKNPDQAGGYFGKFGGGVVKGLAVPNLFIQVSRKTQEVMEMPAKKANDMWEKMYMDIPFARKGLDDMVNALGEPVVPNMSRWVNKTKEDPIWDVIIKNEGWITQPSKDLWIYQNGVKYRRANNKEYYDYAKLRGGMIKESIQKNLESLNKMDAPSAREEITSYISKAGDRARKELALGKYSKSPSSDGGIRKVNRVISE